VVEVVVFVVFDMMGYCELIGVMFGFWGVGSMIADLAISHLGTAVDPPRRLAIALVAWGVAHGAVGVSGEPAVLNLILIMANTSITPTFVSANGMLDDLAPTGTLTEAFTWTSTGISIGI